ncbi:uncharacterized protein ACR2FA_007010 [Aphomia sociella]
MVELPEESYTFITNELIGKTLTIPKFMFDTLEACYVTFPGGMTYEAYPKSNIPENTVFFLEAVQPFVSCGIGFLGAPTTLSGTYRLESLVTHQSDGSQTLSSQNFHLTLIESDPN